MKLAELKRLTQLYRVSQGLATEMTPAEILKAERKLGETPAPEPKITGGQPPVPAPGETS
ncbi:MAG: hypothetical protein V1849_01080 [Chloroflexota bacterium]